MAPDCSSSMSWHQPSEMTQPNRESGVIQHHQNHYWNCLRRPMHPSTDVCPSTLLFLAPQLSSSAPGLLAVHPCNIQQLPGDKCLSNDGAHNSTGPSTVLLATAPHDWNLYMITAMMVCTYRSAEVSNVTLLGPEPVVQSCHVDGSYCNVRDVTVLGPASSFGNNCSPLSENKTDKKVTQTNNIIVRTCWETVTMHGRYIHVPQLRVC